MTKQEAARILAYLRVAYPNTAIPEFAEEIWADQFSEQSVGEVFGAVKVHTKASKFFPTFAEVFAILDGDDDLSNLTADQVWSSLRRKIGNVGTLGQPLLTPLEREVVRQFGGWRLLCQSELDEVFKRLPRIVDTAKREVRQQQRLDELGEGTVRRIGS